MAAVLVAPVRESQEFKIDISVELCGYIARAKDHLLLKDFEDCMKTCMCGIARAKLFVEDERAQKCMEQLCVLCIQALAEMNQWHDVLPLIQDIYSGIEFCPSMVIQLSILLHARVKEYPQCHALASVWLRCQDNSCRPGYDRVAALYIEHVMLPQDRFVLVPQFLNSCTHLNQGAKDAIMTQCKKLNAKLVEKVEMTTSRDGDNNNSSKETLESDSGRKSDINESDTSVVQYMKCLGCFLASKLAFPSLDVLLKMSAAVVTLALLAKFLLNGDKTYTLGKLTVLWQNMMKFLKAIFSPYRPGR